MRRRPQPLTVVLPNYWTGEQALAVAELLQLLRESVLTNYGRQIQDAWDAQLVPSMELQEFDPDEPF
jgi:hypothetical protein